SMIHQEDNNKIKMEYEKELANGSLNDTTKARYERLCSFDELPSVSKISYIRQAKLIPEKLNRIGYEIAGLSDERFAINSFSPKEIYEIAILEHDQWCQEKIAHGWTYGPIRDYDKLIHDCLVPWQDLDPVLQQYDLEAASNIPKIIDSVGLKIVFSKIKLLAVGMYKYYMDGEGVSQKDDGIFSDFMQLPDDIRDSYYKKAVSMVKFLFNLTYELRDINDYGRSVRQLNYDIVEYLAKMEHYEWYREKISTGWKYGPIKDAFKKISPAIVPWVDLDRKTKKFKREFVEHLPKMCENAGLKIVERD
ncbi:RyR domain-containing protein, partial [Methanobrevibacter sp.]|uniref:RyR domain-containing protein n=1 Tax=Methanobrevibacter sp. TaxID=66852 RepID=UPI003890FFD4